MDAPLEAAAAAAPEVPAAPPDAAADAAPPAVVDHAADAARELAAADAALRELGYYYNDVGVLRSVTADGPFVFVNQAHYEKLADAVAEYVQALLLARHGLRRRLVDGVDVYASPDANTASGLLVLICGSGQVAAGQWARRLCINESLRTGAVLPYLDWAAQQGLAVLVLNPNHRRAAARSERHVVAAWDACVAPAAAAHVVLVAHSYGGVCTSSLLATRRGAATARLRAVAFTDSVHGRSAERLAPPERAFFVARCVNWVTSDKPLDAPVRAAVNKPPPDEAADEEEEEEEEDEGEQLFSDSEDADSEDADAAPKRRRKARSFWAPPWCDAARVSAGVTSHEATSEACRPSACAHLLRHLLAAGWTPPQQQAGGAQAGEEQEAAPPVPQAEQPAAAEEGAAADGSAAA